MGNKEIEVYFKTNFIELKPLVKLVSIGLTTARGDYFYAENGDIQQNDCKNEKIFSHLKFGGCGGVVYSIKKSRNSYNIFDDLKFGMTKNNIMLTLDSWFTKLIGDDKSTTIKLITDIGYYDMILFINLFGSIPDLPEYLSYSYYDINQDIANFYNISMKEAINYPRLNIIGHDIDVAGGQYNVLYDAIVIKEVHAKLRNSPVLTPDLVSPKLFYDKNKNQYVNINQKK